MSTPQPLEVSLAPEVDPQWVLRFVAVLQEVDVPGVSIAGVLSAINEEVHRTGRSAEELFGDPREYGQALYEQQYPPQGSENQSSMLRMVVPAIIGFLGMTLCLWAVQPLRDSTDIAIALGVVISAIVVISIMILLGLKAQAFLDLVGNGTAIPMVLGFLTMALILVPIGLLRQTISMVAPLPVAIIGAVLVLVSVVIYLRMKREILAWVPIVLAIAYPLVTVIMVGVTWYFL